MRGMGVWAVVAALIAGTSWVRAEDPAPPVVGQLFDPALAAVPAGQDFYEKAQANGGAKKKEDPPPLYLMDLFSTGWDEDFTRRDSEGRAPDLALLRVQTNFMEREIRVNYFYENNINSKKQKNLDDVDYFIAYAFNRRFMLEVFGNDQWVDGRNAPDSSGPTARFVGRFQLVSLPESSYTFNFQAVAPDEGIGQHQTTLSYGVAGFEDLTHRLGLYRVGLYYSALFDTFAGPGTAGARHDDVQYDVTIAKTLTRPETPLVGNFTVFLENFYQTDLDGSTSGHTVVTLTPGVRFNLGKVQGVKLGLDNWLMFGVDVPVAGPIPYDAVYRFTYIKNF